MPTIRPTAPATSLFGTLSDRCPVAAMACNGADVANAVEAYARIGRQGGFSIAARAH